MANRLAIILVGVLVLCTIIGLSSCGAERGDKELYRVEYQYGSCEGRITTMGMPRIEKYGRHNANKYQYQFVYKDRYGDDKTGIVFTDSIVISIKRMGFVPDGYTIK
jgi:hypothetical protein